MAQNPKQKPRNIFEREIDGVIGTFATTESYDVNYLLGTMKLHSAVDNLQVASEAFPFAKIDFDEMVQRDVDYSRVRRIVENYLKKGSGRVLFFPPLIVAIVATDDNTPKNAYDVVENQFYEESREFMQTIDSDKFQIRLNVSEQPTGYYCIHNEKELHYYNYAATVAWNPQKVKLVVIDGQHRFEALRTLYKSEPTLSSPIEVPICLVYTPHAIKGTSSEEILKDLREMFVRINTTAKQVSGHFIELLKDQSLASISIRELANYWKSSTLESWKSKLHLLEWNEREDNKSRTRQRNYSITTVSILADVLRDYIYANKKEAIPQDILRLSVIKQELEADSGAPRYHQIDDTNFVVTQESLLKEQINTYVVRSLDILLTHATPYRKLLERLESAIENVSKKATEGVSGYKVFQEEILGQFRRWEEYKDSHASKDAQDEFDKIMDDIELPEIPFLNVFQQGYLRLWIKLAQSSVSSCGIDPATVASFTVEALDPYVFQNCDKIFGKNQLYANRVLYTNNKPNVSGWGKSAWTNLLQAALLCPVTQTAIQSTLEYKVGLNDESKTKLKDVIRDIGQAGLTQFNEELAYRVRKDIETNWPVKDYDRGIKKQLEEWRDSESPESKERFIEEIERLVQEALEEAKMQLGNVLKLNIAGI